MQKQIYKSEVQRNKIVQVETNVVQVLAKKKKKKTILKLKIHMQLFWGSCVGVKFRSLEAN